MLYIYMCHKHYLQTRTCKSLCVEFPAGTGRHTAMCKAHWGSHAKEPVSSHKQ
jgi:hypothetical protein